jgi:protoporphyrin/coproporphyrin ferrochelatase
VVEIPRPLWWLILHGIVLRVRPKKSARAYRAIWTEQGSPLLALTEQLASALRAELRERGLNLSLEIAMRYGKPSLPDRLETLKRNGVDRIWIVPLYPQYAAATNASIFDAVSDALRRWRHVPELGFVSDYHDDRRYIAAVGAGIRQHWEAHGKAEMLLMSFHGLPERSRALGDPYHEQCLRTGQLVAEFLGLEENAWKIVFQSRFGPAQWIKPYCVEVLKALPDEGVKSVDVVCPGFAVDCLETLEEIAIANREIFLEAGGESYRYVPALNSRPEHVRMLADLLEDKLPGEATRRSGAL